MKGIYQAGKTPSRAGSLMQAFSISSKTATLGYMSSHLRELCQRYLQGETVEADFLRQCLQQASQQLPLAQVDHDRPARCGFPEVVFGERKPDEALVAIVQSLIDRNQPVLVTRINETQAALLMDQFPAGNVHAAARTFRLMADTDQTPIGKVPVITAGTSDQAVAWEAIETLRWMNVHSIPLFDLGVAGPHRLPAQTDNLLDADAVVVAAGMEGALPSVVGGYTPCPVFAVPTSIGYGASFQGVAALLSMLNSCAANVAVVNIDAGFKAGYLAGLVAHQRANSSRSSRSTSE